MSRRTETMSREFKNSGIEWIGQIPKEWEVELIGNNIKEINDKNDDSSEDNALQFKMGSIISKKGGDSKYNPESLAAYTKVKEGDIVINGLNLSFDLISQRVGLVREKGVITSTYLTLRPSSLLHSEFVNYLFKAYDNCKAFHGMGRGLRQILAYRELKNQKLIYPPLPEQQKIADFLDKVCGEVDEMVTLLETMIEELKAYKQSVITEAVTKGLNPNVPMRNSGIDWIGNIPKHWQMKRLKFMCEIQTGNQDTQDAEQDGEYPFYVRSPKVEHSNKYSFEGEGILMAGDGAGAGRVFHHAFGKYAVHQRVYRLSSFDDIDTTFLFHYIRNLFCKVMDMGSAQSTVPSVRLPMLQNFVVCIPSIEEQQYIATYLDTKCSEIDALIALKQAKIEELKEYKKSVIYEYVTGKKEVV